MSRGSCVLAFVLLGCGGSSLPAPEVAEQPLAAFNEVPYPPPAALAETVPPRPDRAGVVWLDGEWVYHGDAFAWRRGGWVVPPPTGRFAAWRAWYRRDGRLMMASGTWYGPRQQRLRRPQPIVPAYTPPNDVTSESQTAR